MTRREQIEQELVGSPDFEYSEDFISGVEWADAHPITADITPRTGLEIREALSRLSERMKPNIECMRLEYTGSSICVYLRRTGVGAGRYFSFWQLDSSQHSEWWDSTWESMMRYINKANNIKQ